MRDYYRNYKLNRCEMVSRKVTWGIYFVGEVELENLPLKKDALRHLGLPIEIKVGFIGKVKLQVPVTQPRSAPWVIVIDQLYVVASPLPVHEWDATLEGAIAQELKLSALDALEARWRIESEPKDVSLHYASSYSSWLSFGTGVITNIIENLQVPTFYN